VSKKSLLEEKEHTFLFVLFIKELSSKNYKVGNQYGEIL